MFPRLDLYYADPPQLLATARGALDDLDHDLSVQGVWFVPINGGAVVRGLRNSC